MNRTQDEFASNPIFTQETGSPSQQVQVMNNTFSNFKQATRRTRKFGHSKWGSMSGRQVGKKSSPTRDYDISFVNDISLKSAKRRGKLQGSSSPSVKEKYELPNAHLELTASEQEDEFA